MIGRITSQQLLATSSENVGASRLRLARLQEQASSGKAITRPSDDPAAAAAAMRVRGEQRANQQYATNIDDGLGWLGTADQALGTSEDLLQKAVELAVQGGNGSVLTASGRESIAQALEGIRNDLMNQANATYNGRSVFAGNSDTGRAFDASYAFTGVAGATVQRRVSSGETVTVDASGQAAFGTGATSGFAALDALAAALRSNDGAAISTGIDALTSRLTAVTGERAAVGSRLSRLESSKSSVADTALNLETRRAGIEDVDQAQVLIDLKSTELGYQTALQVAARTLQPTLMSFLS